MTKLALVLASTALFLATTGCEHVRPDALTAAAVHQSVPFRGEGPPPFGDHRARNESNLDGIQLGVEWETGRVFADAGATYALHQSFMRGGPWFFQARMGLRLRLGQPAPKRTPPAGQGPFPAVEPLWPEDPDPWGTLNPRPQKGKAP